MPYKKLITKVLQRYWRASRGLHMDVAALITDGSGAVMLVRTAHPSALWRLPGGPVLQGETASVALARVLAEQAAIFEAAEALLHDVRTAASVASADQTLVYLVRDWRQGASGAEARFERAFFEAGRLPQPIAPATADAIAAARAFTATRQ